jgi:hypothetical protein
LYILFVSLYKFFLLKKIVKLRQFFAVNKKKERKKESKYGTSFGFCY